MHWGNPIMNGQKVVCYYLNYESLGGYPADLPARGRVKSWMPELQEVSGRPPSKFQIKWICLGANLQAPKLCAWKVAYQNSVLWCSELATLRLQKAIGSWTKCHTTVHTPSGRQEACVCWPAALPVQPRVRHCPFRTVSHSPVSCDFLTVWDLDSGRPQTLLSAVWEAAEHPWTGKWIGKANSRVSSWKPNCLLSKSQYNMIRNA